ncbi:hypothetical protein ACSMXN_11245 [Jatrophihabitans sp. DSM 45814]
MRGLLASLPLARLALIGLGLWGATVASGIWRFLWVALASAGAGLVYVALVQRAKARRRGRAAVGEAASPAPEVD